LRTENFKHIYHVHPEILVTVWMITSGTSSPPAEYPHLDMVGLFRYAQN